ncbi:hypothetical protein [Gloeothece verrucosa]|uniref:Uncharacterized protein n=1 Tax=Gloeothece verrucosa (strain PCC 7822) TaxID=497965 RepID=E0UBF6_GLOV7|nr:hypothetical protein [Gloeothece verrucosa]ADN12788.1 hypothetical protein Cyan7822_0762 [Gloeothece verrucosa PCC 7822]
MLRLLFSSTTLGNLGYNFSQFYNFMLLENLLLEGLESGEATEMTQDDWQEIRHAVGQNFTTIGNLRYNFSKF